MKEREEEVLKFIKDFMLKNGYTPTIRQIGFGVNLRSTSSVHVYFDRLVERGEIEIHGKNYVVKGMRYIEDQHENNN